MIRPALCRRIKTAEAKARTDKAPRIIRGGMRELYRLMEERDTFTKLFGEQLPDGGMMP